MRYRQQEKRQRRVRRVRSRIVGTAQRPRLAVFRSNKHIAAQLINDETGETLVEVTDLTGKLKGTKSEKAAAVGKLLAEKAKRRGVKAVVFDRRHYKFHGRVAALAQAAREAGLEL